MWNQIIEDAIVGKLVTTLVDEGYRVELCDQDGGGLYVYAAALDENEGRKPRAGFRYWARLTPGNGVDVITDYTANLDTDLQPVLAFAEKFR